MLTVTLKPDPNPNITLPLITLLLLPFYGPLSGTTRMSRYQKKHSPTDTYPDHQSSFICFLHLLRSMTSSLFNLRAWQSVCTISVQVYFGLPFGLVVVVVVVVIPVVMGVDDW